MQTAFGEADWKYLRSIHDEMLHALCSRINKRAAEIAMAEGRDAHKQYLALYRHIKDADAVIAVCFNDWRRSTIGNCILALRHNSLLHDSHVAHLSDSAREWLANFEESL